MRRISSLLIVALLCGALLAGPVASAHRLTVYRGKTAQKHKLQLSIGPSEVTMIRFKVQMLCRDGSLLYGDLSDFEPTPLRRRRFSDTQYGPTDAVSWRGRAHGREVTGTLRVKDRLSGGVRCDSGPVRFSARRVG